MCVTLGHDLELIGKSIDKDKKIAIGGVSHRTLQVERPDEVAALIRKAMEHIEPERLIISNDCGFGREGMSRTHVYFKMLSIARGANIVKKELGLEEAYIPGEDERYALLEAPQ